jgi:type I restriction enzyme M protein
MGPIVDGWASGYFLPDPALEARHPDDLEDAREFRPDVASPCPLYHDQQAGRGGAPLPGARALQERRPAPVERPLKLNFQAAPERIARLEEEKAFQGLAQSKTKGAAGAREQAEGRAQQAAIRTLLRMLPGTLFRDRDEFESVLETAARKADVKLSAPVMKAIVSALSERDATAAICRDKDGSPEPDPELRDTESVPLSESIEAFFEREVKPHVPDAWIDTERRDPKDGEIGLVGYEINFNRYFYRYSPPRPLEAIEADIQALEKDIVAMLREVAG